MAITGPLRRQSNRKYSDWATSLKARRFAVGLTQRELGLLAGIPAASAAIRIAEYETDAKGSSNKRRATIDAVLRDVALGPGTTKVMQSRHVAQPTIVGSSRPAR